MNVLPCLDDRSSRNVNLEASALTWKHRGIYFIAKICRNIRPALSHSGFLIIKCHSCRVCIQYAQSLSFSNNFCIFIHSSHFPSISGPVICRYLTFIFHLSPKCFAKQNAWYVHKTYGSVCVCMCTYITRHCGSQYRNEAVFSSSQDLTDLSWPVLNFSF